MIGFINFKELKYFYPVQISILNSRWYFSNINKSGCFWKQLFRKKLLKNHFLKSLRKQSYADVPKNRCCSKFPNIDRKTSLLGSFLIRLKALRPANSIKSDFSTGTSLWILKNFYKKFFLSKSSSAICRYSLLNQKQCEMVYTKKVYRSGYSTIFTH